MISYGTKVRKTALLSPILAVCLLLSSCPGGDEVRDGERRNRAPKITGASLRAPEFKPGAEAELYVTYSDPDKDELRLEYQWFVDGEQIEGASSDKWTLNAAGGSKVFAKVKAVEVEGDLSTDWVKSNTVTLEKPPIPKLAGVNIHPSEVYNDTDLSAAVDLGELDEFDVDEIYYRWEVNGQVAREGTDSSLDPSEFKRGDRISVSASFSPEFPDQATVDSMIHTVVNRAPVWTRAPDIDFRGDYGYIEFGIHDPDGDEVKINIQGAPPGTTSAGKDRARFPTSKLSGRYTITIIASDGHGGTVSGKASFVWE